MKRRRYRAHHVGRLRVRAAAILNANFPEWDVRLATGYWRTDVRAGVYRWELYSRLKRRNSHDGSELPVVHGCWETLTEFVRGAAKRGCHLTRHGDIYSGHDPDAAAGLRSPRPGP